MKKIEEWNNEMIALLYSVLQGGLGGRGYNMEQLRTITPVMEKLEELGKDSGEGVLWGKNTTYSFDLKESEYDLVKKVVEGSIGWSAGKKGRIILKLVDLVKELPTVKGEINA